MSTNGITSKVQRFLGIVEVDETKGTLDLFETSDDVLDVEGWFQEVEDCFGVASSVQVLEQRRDWI